MTVPPVVTIPVNCRKYAFAVLPPTLRSGMVAVYEVWVGSPVVVNVTMGVYLELVLTVSIWNRCNLNPQSLMRHSRLRIAVVYNC